MKIIILEPESQNFEEVERETIKALMEEGTFGEVQWINDMEKIQKYGVDQPPGMVINEKIKGYGKVPNKDEIKKWIQEEK